eukprot:gnl/TRDRNA2_/TRDRNA2_193701_c0_seq1.p1 gnl/TRDRNA2_/TRDRNA2_193701_c0~~gnl/TRDRNA2_/TRDRNA2_193701_c0_seq1.p1  ORF type:complete len:226 (-),score=63.87 gnl/TRDRNA2_/TRDRNA2_193701_c0_seq1:320-997(-)
MEVKYFAIPGRGESIRLLLAIGNIDFKDTPVDFKAFMTTMKKQTRWQVVPTLTLPSGQVVGQSQAILRYLGKHIKVDGKNLTPESDEEALIVDEVLQFVGEDIWRVLLKVVGEKDADEQGKALMGPNGKVVEMLDELEKQIAGKDSVLATGTLSTADIYIFAAFGWWSSGFMTKHVNTSSLLQGRPKLQAIVDRVGALPQVKAYYSTAAKKAQPMAHVYQQMAKL